MHSTIGPALSRGHLSRHERQQLARAEAFSRRTARVSPLASSVKLAEQELDLIERLVRQDRTPVSSALLAVAGIGTGEARRRAVLSHVGEAACSAQAAGLISLGRGDQIARHITRAVGHGDQALAA